ALVTKYLTLLLPLVIVYVAWVKVAESQGRKVAGEQGRGAASNQIADRQLGGASPGIRPTQHVPRTTRPIYYYLAQALIAYLLIITPWFAYLVTNFNEIDNYGPVLGTLAPLIRGDGSDRTVEGIFAWLSGGQAPEPAYIDQQSYSIGQILAELPLTFWGNPIVEPYPLNWFVMLMALMTILAIIGLIIYFRLTIDDLRAKTAERSKFIIHNSSFIILILTCLLPVPFMLIRLFGARDALEAVQGRHILFLAGPAFAILFVYGFTIFWITILPRRGVNILRFTFYGLLALLLTASMAQLLFMKQAYPPLLPVRTTTALPAGVEPPPQPVRLPNNAALVGYRLLDENDQALHIEMFWQGSDSWALEDYQTKLALVDAGGHIQSEWFGYQTQAHYPTRAWETGDTIRDEGWLPLVGLPAGDYRIQLQILGEAGPITDWQTVERYALKQPISPPSTNSDWLLWHNGQITIRPPLLRERETVQLTPPNYQLPITQLPNLQSPISNLQLPISSTFTIPPQWPAGDYTLTADPSSPIFRIAESARNFDLPVISHPLDVNFAGHIKLLGYDLATHRAEPGGGLPVTLYWQGLDWMGEEFIIFNRLLDNQQLAWGGYDRMAQENYSTLLWAPQEIIVDGFAVPVAPDAPDGVYTLSIGWYQQVDDGSQSLPILRPETGEVTDATAVTIGPIKVGGPPPGATVDQVEPQFEVNTVLGDKIRLLGIDRNFSTSCETLPLTDCPLSLTFYWIPIAPIDVDYTVFVHVRNEAGETVAQNDRPPLEGAYPTSLWDEGEIIQDELSIPLNPIEPGRYDIAIGMYDHSTGTRLVVDGTADNAIVVYSFEFPTDADIHDSQ
ncbi:MAG: hypothetical protein KDI79_14580, partial [Anaerolineae bacterium]|nr:hypothetical protein [Anaerolineae bacterium]